MAVEVRTIDKDDIPGWVGAMATGFLVELAEGEVEDRGRQLLFDRTWAAFDDGRVVGTLRSFPSTLTVPGCRRLPTAALTNVTVSPTHRRQGLLTRMITADLQRAHERGEPAGMLIASEYPIYRRFGYGPAVEGASWSVDALRARFRRAAPGRVELVDAGTLAIEGPAVYDRVRQAQPGAIVRSPAWWERLIRPGGPRGKDAAPAYQALYRSEAGSLDGYVRYRAANRWEQMRPAAVLTVEDLQAVTPDAYLRLWQYCCEVDLVVRVEAADRSVDEALPWLLADGRVATQTGRFDFVWLRLLDVAATLAARTYAAPGRLVVEVVDPLGLAGGRFLLEGGPDGATCRPAPGETADLTFPVDGLGAVYLGGVGVHTAATAGWVDEHRPGALAAAGAMLSSAVTPWCATWF